MLSVAITGCVPEIAVGWVTEQVGGSTAFEGLLVTAHASDTLPVKPPLGVMVTCEVAEPPGEIAFTALLLNEKFALDLVPGVVYVQVRIFWLAVKPPVPPVNPT
jgi:hypothetical protein